MKKILSLILVLILCLSLVACSSEKEQNNNSDVETNPAAPMISLIGEWKTLSGSAIVFYEGGLGYAPAGDSFDWSVDSESSQYVVSYQGRTFNISADTDNGARFVFFEGMKFYHIDDFEKVSK